MPDKHQGPFLTMAVFCDTVIEGKDNVLSIIRLVDTANVTIPPDTQQPIRVSINVTLASSFRAGGAKGTYTLKLEVETPTNKISVIGETPISFQGPAEQGANIISSLELQIQDEGVYWFNIYLEDKFMTRVPLRVAYQHQDVEPATKPSVELAPSTTSTTSPETKQP